MLRMALAADGSEATDDGGGADEGCASGDDVRVRASWWVEQAGGFDRAVCEAAAEAHRELSMRSDRTWGALHATHIAHPVPKLLGFAPGTFPDPPLMPTGGDTNTPCQVATKSNYDLSASATHVSARLLIDMADPAHRFAIITPLGASEIAGSAHVADNLHDWHAGELRWRNWNLAEAVQTARYTATCGTDAPGQRQANVAKDASVRKGDRDLL